MSGSIHDVAIIGAGFTGASLAVQLSRCLPTGARIVLIGTPGEIGRGQAYGTENPEHLLNVRADRMSFFADDASDFVTWLQRQQPNEDFTARYLPRQTYGRYVRDTLNLAIAKKQQRIHFDVIEGTAVDVEHAGRSFRIRLASGEQYRTTAVALCTGNGRSDFPLRPESVAADAHDFIISRPFSDYRLGTIDRHARILFVGTGLTMVDQVLTLTQNGHTGPMLAVSRHGLLPTAHLVQRTAPRVADLPSVELTLTRLFALVAAAAREEAANDGDWRAVVDGLRPRTQEFWQRLSTVDRRRFLRHVESFWSVHRHRMAPSVALRIAQLRDSDRLQMRAGRVVSVCKTARGVTAALRARSGRTIELLPFDWIINCTGPGRDTTIADPLLARLIARGLAFTDPHGRGLDVGPDGNLLDRGGRPVPGLYAAGPITAGRFLEITAVPEIREQTPRVAAALAGFIEEANKPPVRLTYGGSR